MDRLQKKSHPKRPDPIRKTILVTGAAGLVGKSVQLTLESAGYEVLAIDRVESSDDSPVLRCDLTDVAGLRELARHHELGAIVHCGAFSGPMVGADNPAEMVQVNIVGTANILELSRMTGQTRVVFCSSTSAYGPTAPGPVPEDVALKPSSVYGASKVASESLLNAYSQQFGVDAVSLRLSWIYGPKRKTDCIIRTMIIDALQGQQTLIPYGRNFPRQYIHITDATRAIINALLTSRLPRFNYNITGGTWVTLSQIANIVKEILPDADITLADGPDPLDDWQGQFDISAAARDLEYTPEIDLKKGIATYVEWLKIHKNFHDQK